MANGFVVLVAMFSVAAVILIYVLAISRKRQAQAEPPRTVSQVRPEVERSQSTPPKPLESTASQKPLEASEQVPRTIKMETVNTTAPPNSTNRDVNSTAISADAKPAAVIDVQAVLNTA